MIRIVIRKFRCIFYHTMLYLSHIRLETRADQTCIDAVYAMHVQEL